MRQLVGKMSSVLRFFVAPRILSVGLLLLPVFHAASGQAVANNPPVITDLSAGIVYGDFWWVAGQVIDENPEACTILFGESLDEAYCYVNSDGSFVVVLELSNENYGLFTAQTMDDIGQWSEMTYGWVGY